MNDRTASFSVDDVGEPITFPTAEEMFQVLGMQNVTTEGLTIQGGVWYLSFGDDAIAATIAEEERRPGGLSWLGGCYVEALTLPHAVNQAWEHGCNPGGSVLGVGPIPIGVVPASHMNRLITTLEGLEFQ